MQHFLIAEAMYWERIGEYEKSLTTYDAFLHTDYAEINSSLYKEVLQDKADLLVKMGRKEEAYKQYGLVFSYIKSSFEKNYPKKELVLQDFMDVEYIPLETNDEFITQGDVMAIDNKYIVVRM